jgi:hypothetical protein
MSEAVSLLHAQDIFMWTGVKDYTAVHSLDASFAVGLKF